MSIKTQHITNFQSEDQTTWKIIKNSDFQVTSVKPPEAEAYVTIQFNKPEVINYLKKVLNINDSFIIRGRYNNQSLIRTYRGTISSIEDNVITIDDIDYPNLIGGDNTKYYGDINSDRIFFMGIESIGVSSIFEKYYPIKKITFQVKNFSTDQFRGTWQSSQSFEPFISCKINNWEEKIQFCEPFTIDCGERMKIYKISNCQNFDNEHLDFIHITYETED